jgi:glycine cleavage system aminomethyltransferase T
MHMLVDPDLLALRTGVARSARPVAILRVVGEQAFDVLDAVSPRPLFLRDGQALHTLFLDDDAHPFADVYILCDDLDYLVIAEGPTPADLIAWLGARVPAGLDAEIRDLTPTHTLMSLDGPYAWELLGRLVGPEVVGVPYLSLFFLRAFDGLGLRAGKTGEFGYDLLVPTAALPGIEAILPGEEFALGSVDVDTLDLCALENGFFSIRTPGVAGLTPVELQLQWRMDRRRQFPGRSALDAARERVPPRVTWFRGEPGAPVPASGTLIALDGETVGEVLVGRHSPILDAPVGQVLLPRSIAHTGLTLTTGGARLRTVSAPLLRNRSLFINAQRHAWASRHVDAFPPLVLS